MKWEELVFWQVLRTTSTDFALGIYCKRLRNQLFNHVNDLRQVASVGFRVLERHLLRGCDEYFYRVGNGANERLKVVVLVIELQLVLTTQPQLLP